MGFYKEFLVKLDQLLQRLFQLSVVELKFLN